MGSTGHRPVFGSPIFVGLPTSESSFSHVRCLPQKLSPVPLASKRGPCFNCGAVFSRGIPCWAILGSKNNTRAHTHTPTYTPGSLQTAGSDILTSRAQRPASFWRCPRGSWGVSYGLAESEKGGKGGNKLFPCDRCQVWFDSCPKIREGAEGLKPEACVPIGAWGCVKTWAQSLEDWVRVVRLNLGSCQGPRQLGP